MSLNTHKFYTLSILLRLQPIGPRNQNPFLSQRKHTTGLSFLTFQSCFRLACLQIHQKVIISAAFQTVFRSGRIEAIVIRCTWSHGWLLLYRGLSRASRRLGLEPKQQSCSQAVLGVVFQDGGAPTGKTFVNQAFFRILGHDVLSKYLYYTHILRP